MRLGSSSEREMLLGEGTCSRGVFAKKKGWGARKGNGKRVLSTVGFYSGSFIVASLVCNFKLGRKRDQFIQRLFSLIHS